MRKLCNILLLCTVSWIGQAQDGLFSIYSSQPLTLNPALTGAFEEDFRASVGYRNQWASIADAFTSSVASFDIGILRKPNDPNYLGVGGYVLTDKAGTSNLGLLQATGSAAYHLGMNDRNKLSAGLQISYGQRSITVDGLRWDSQFNGVGYDPTLPTNENFNGMKATYLDLSTGLVWEHADKRHYRVGYSFWHFGQRQGFLASNDDRLFARHVVFADYFTSLSFVDLTYRIKTEMQSGAFETTLGVEAKYRVGSDSRYTDANTSSAVMAGVYYRHRDNITPLIGYEYKRMVNFWFSYDFNVSQLSRSTSYQGGWELHLTYLGSLSKDRRKLR